MLEKWVKNGILIEFTTNLSNYRKSLILCQKLKILMCENTQSWNVFKDYNWSKQFWRNTQLFKASRYL